jgi:hypothetical protein
VESLFTVMQEPFPALEDLILESVNNTAALPDTFLGGSVPRLQSLGLINIPFPGLPKLLLSSNDLFRLVLQKIPNTGYISPEAMATCVSALTRLEMLTIEFQPPAYSTSRLGRPSPLPRFVLPALTTFDFRGISEYLEVLMARIDALLLQSIDIIFFNRPFYIQQLPHFFIRHAGMFRPYNQASVVFDGHLVAIKLHPSEEKANLSKMLILGISYGGVNWQLSSMAKISLEYRSLLSSVEQLDIDEANFSREDDMDDTLYVDDTHWLEFFDSFTAVRTLRISRNLIMPALQGLAREMATGALPALDSLYLEDYQPSGSEQQAIGPFIAARRCSRRPVAVHCWDSPKSEWWGDWVFY